MEVLFHSIKERMLHFAVLLSFAFAAFIASGTFCTVAAETLPLSDKEVEHLGCKKLPEPVPLTILFTNDGHSSGNYTQMSALIKREKQKAQAGGSAVVVVDAGDISMGSVFQTLYTHYAFDYVAKAIMGYDAVTCGNHDFDFGFKAFWDMLKAARRSPYIAGAKQGYSLPQYVVSNINTRYPPHFSELGIKDTLLLYRNVEAENEERRVAIGIYGLMGEHAYSCISNNDSLLFLNRLETASKAVEALKKRGADYILALSHGGTLWAKGAKIEKGTDKYAELKKFTEDGILARTVLGTDVIISGHDHELLNEPLVFGNTVIGSAGSKNGYLGKIVMIGDSLAEYSMIPVKSDSLADTPLECGIFENDCMSKYIGDSYSLVANKFLDLCGVVLNDTIAVADRELPLKIDSEGNMELGYYIADSYRIAAESAYRTLGQQPVGIVPYGVIRNGIKSGYITNRDVFETLSLGMGSDGIPGYPLVMAWVTGDELYDICELNASVAWGMEDARLFFSGMTFEYNRYCIPFTKVTKVFVNGNPVEKNKLYPIVTGLYTAQLIGILKSSSFGLLSVAPKNEEGKEIEDFSSSLLFCKNSNGDFCTMPEWQAFAEYIKKTKLKNPGERNSMDNSTLLVYIKYLLIFSIVVTAAVWLLRFGRREHCRQP